MSGRPRSRLRGPRGSARRLPARPRRRRLRGRARGGLGGPAEDGPPLRSPGLTGDARAPDPCRGAPFGTISRMSTPETPPTPVERPARRRGAPALPRVLRRARPHDRAQREPDPGRRPDPPLHELRDGPVQGGLHRRREAQLHARRRRAALPAGGREAQRLRGGRALAAPPHPLRDDGQLELRRLLQARGDPLGLGVPHEGARHPGRAPGRHDLLRRRGRLGDLARRDRPAARADGALGRRRAGRRQELLADGRDRALRPVQRDPLRPRRPPLRGPGVRPGPLRDVPALGWRSGTSSSWSSTSSPTGRACRCRSPASTPGWASSASPPSCRASSRTTTPTSSRRSTRRCAGSSATTRRRSRRSASATR